jgi:hypothetical protein
MICIRLPPHVPHPTGTVATPNITHTAIYGGSTSWSLDIATSRGEHLIEKYVQFCDAAFAFGGKAGLVLVPRSSSSARMSALSFFGSGGT